MLIAFVIVLIITWVAILFSVYSIFTPFYQSFGDIVDYNVAYYWAISSVERGQLILKYRWPGFAWSGGWLDTNTFGKSSDVVLSGFTISLANKNWMFRDISSRTKRIPNIWEWNVDIDLWSTDSMNYNKLDYRGVETFLLSVDTWGLDYYYNTGWSYREAYWWTSLSGQFRLPPKILSWFGNVWLCNTDIEICDPDWDGLYDDIVVDWSLKGYYNWNQFFVMPSESVARYWSENTVQSWDTTIRESNINVASNIIFGDSYNIFNDWSDPDKQNVVSNDDTIAANTFQDILSVANYSWLELKFALVNLLSSLSGNIYPFLEYFFTFDQEVADRFYTIQWNGRKWDYDIKIIIKKPTFKETVAGSFTVVF